MVSVGRALTPRRLYRGARRHGEGRMIERYGELSVVMDLLCGASLGVRSPVGWVVPRGTARRGA